MPLLRHLEASTVFSVLSEILHSWILTYITSPSLEFDVEQGESWLMACLINKEGLRAFPPSDLGWCHSIVCVLLMSETPAKKCDAQEDWKAEYTSHWTCPFARVLMNGETIITIVLQGNQYSVQNFFSLMGSCIVKEKTKRINTIFSSRATLYIPDQMQYI